MIGNESEEGAAAAATCTAEAGIEENADEVDVDSS